MYVYHRDRLSAQDILTVKKIMDYQVSKTFGDKSEDKSDQLEIMCQDQVRTHSTHASC